MKKIVSAVLLSTLAFTAFTQTTDVRRKAEVTGSAEKEVTPDIIYINISLKEYFKDNNNKNKVSIDVLEKQLYNAAIKAGVKPEDFTINNISSYNFPADQKKKDPGFLASKQYRIKVTNLNRLNDILEAVDSRGIQSSGIGGYDYSKMDELRNEIRIKAVQSARNKAAILAEALGDKLGKALEINDHNSDGAGVQPMVRAQMAFAKAADMASEESLELDFRKITVSYQIRVVFELL